MANEIFENIRHTDENGNEFWMARELAITVGYKDYRNFKGVIEKAQRLCKDNNANEADHFVECTEMVEVGSGTKRPVLSFFDGDTIWTTQKRIAEIFHVEVSTVNYHWGRFLILES